MPAWCETWWAIRRRRSTPAFDPSTMPRVVRIVAKTFAAPCSDPHDQVWVERVATCRRPPLNDMAIALDSHIGGPVVCWTSVTYVSRETSGTCVSLKTSAAAGFSGRAAGVRNWIELLPRMAGPRRPSRHSRHSRIPATHLTCCLCTPRRLSYRHPGTWRPPRDRRSLVAGS